jgi:hypothetical protein
MLAGSKLAGFTNRVITNGIVFLRGSASQMARFYMYGGEIRGNSIVKTVANDRLPPLIGGSGANATWQKFVKTGGVIADNGITGRDATITGRDRWSGIVFGVAGGTYVTAETGINLEAPPYSTMPVVILPAP